MQEFPIHQVVPDVKQKLLTSNTLILQAPPGAGKSTILPIELLKEPWLQNQKIIMLEPRRLAARSVANRMADLLNEEAGETVGYRVRFENKTSSKTKIEVVTEGILTRMLQSDNSLEGVAMIVFDEFHERSLHADLALALCRQAQQILRNDLKIMVMSATLNSGQLSSVLENAPVITSQGRQHPVQIKYVGEDKSTYIPQNMSRVIIQALRESDGDILAFLPGTGDIHKTVELLEYESVAAELFPLYGDLPFKQQQQALLPIPGKRKIVLSTSIAETSLTIEGIKAVVDSGYSRVPRFDLRTGLTRLETVKVTKDAADQRAGRAGRLGPGTAYRLWTEGEHLHLQEQRKPEILDADLAPLLLELYQWGVKNVNELMWVTPPLSGAVAQAKELLQQLEAIGDNVITDKGKKIVKLPTHPRFAHMLLEAETEGKQLTALACDIAAVLEERDPLGKGAGSDLLLRIEALRKYRNKERVNADRGALDRIERLSAAWRKLMKVEVDNSPANETSIGKLIAAAYPERVAKQASVKNNTYRLVNGRTARLPEGDTLLNTPWLAIAQMDGGTNEGKIFLAAAIDKDEILHLAKEREVVKWDEEKQMIVAQKERYLGGITIDALPILKINEEQRISVWCEVIKNEGLKMLNWTEEQEQWQAKIKSLAKWRSQEAWPDVSNEYLINTTKVWLAPFLINAIKKDDLKKLNLNEILDTLIPWDLQQKINKLSPEKIEVPSGSWIKINYQADGSSPVMEVRLQEMFGLPDTPTVNEGKVKVTLHLLSPGYKPVQVTQDLKSFWNNTYAEVKKELKQRYPKHSWPDDPWTAQAIRGAKKRFS